MLLEFLYEEVIREKIILIPNLWIFRDTECPGGPEAPTSGGKVTGPGLTVASPWETSCGPVVNPTTGLKGIVCVFFTASTRVMMTTVLLARTIPFVSSTSD